MPKRQKAPSAARRTPIAPRRVPLAAIISFALLAAYMVFVFPGATAKAALDAPGAYSLDKRLFTAPEAILAWAIARTDAERLAEIGSHWTFDLAYPLLYGLFFSTAWSWALRRLAGDPSRARTLSRFVLAAPAFDIAENLAITVLFAYAPPAGASFALASPEVSAAARIAVWILAAATPLKWAFAGLALAGSIILPVLAIREKFRA